MRDQAGHAVLVGGGDAFAVQVAVLHVDARRARHHPAREGQGGCLWLLAGLLGSMGLWFLREHLRLAFVVVMVLVVGLVVVLAWRLMLPARATRVLSMLGGSK